MRGSTRKRGSTWSYVVDLGPDPATGKRRQTMKGGFRTKKDAQAALGAILGDAQTGAHNAPTRHRLGGFLTNEWLPAVRPRLRPSTFATYTVFATKYVAPRLGAVPIAGLSAAQLNTFYAELLDRGGRGGKPLATKTVRHVHQLIRTALGDAVRWGMVARNIAEAADPPALKRSEMRVWSPDELAGFLVSTENDRLSALWLLMATTGLRRSEVVGLPWSAVDLAVGRLSVVQTAVKAGSATVLDSATKSTRSRRGLAIDDSTVTALKGHRARQLEERLSAGPAWRDSGLVFVREDGSGIDPVWVARRFQRLIADSGLPRIRLHDVRHSWATAALGAGVPLKVVSERLGHASVSITADTYQHVTEGLDRQAADTVAALILRKS
jgi:integrase